MKKIKEVMEEVGALYFKEGYTTEQISLKLGLSELAVKNSIKALENEKYELSKLTMKKDSKVSELRKNAIKNLGFIESLEGETLVKIDYANDWTKASSEIVKNALKNQMALGYARSLVYPNLLDEIVDIVAWQKEELGKIRHLMRTDQIKIDEANYKIKNIKLMVSEQLKAIGVKNDKALSDLIDKIGNLNVSEERLKTEKAKILVEENNSDKTIEILKQIGGIE